MNVELLHRSLTEKLIPKRLWARLSAYAQPAGAQYAEQADTSYAPLVGSGSFLFRTRRGQQVAIRRVTSDDITSVCTMFERLSARTVALRYMMPRPLIGEAAHKEARRIVYGQPHNRVALVVTTQPADGGELVAVAELARDSQQPAVGEIALVVRDDAQQAGIGGALLRQLVALAPSMSISMLHADLLAENRAMHALIRNLGLPYTSTYHYDILEITIQLPYSVMSVA